uniref:DNA helicase MCM9 n=1 Tax=Anopheles dirus TaxID=7168 RepID=A0A182N5Y1_9DIPT
MEAYLKQYHDQEITDLLNNPDDLLHVSIHVNLTHLQRKQPELFARIFQDIAAEQVRWNECLLRAQKTLIEGNLFLEPGFQIKHNCHVRFVNLPISPAELRKAAYPNNDSVGQFLQVKGSVIRMTSSRFLEYRREYACTRCKRKVLIEAEYCKSYVFEPPGPCPSAREAGCRGQLQAVSAQPQPEHCRDYQEVRIQEIMSERNVPASLVVTLEDDLVDSCQPGDCVTVCGRIEHRWKPPVVGRRTEVTIAMRANSVAREESKASWAKDLPEHLLCVQAEWQEVLREIGELAARDLLVQSIAPAIRGMYPVKLAIALALASCTERHTEGGESGQQHTTTVRGHSHLLLVGDPGLAKSQLLKFASEIASRAVYTTGMGCSSAGLTAAAVKDEGEWQLEAGALVLADGGICCIDEFNLMRETDKASIHEAMEQQTISVAKAGMVCKLSTRCVVMAATNPKNLYTMSDGEGTSAANIGIGGPLLSRFDMVLILRDIRAADWDADIATHLLALALLDEDRASFGTEGDPTRVAHWELEKLQLHFAAIKDIHPKVSHEANVILGAYYKACRSDPYRDPTRTTVRLLDSLFRLAQAHARLLLRTEVTPLDAITIIQLMEASWGFGKIGIPTYDLIKAQLPLGPQQNFIDRLMDTLQLHDVVQDATVRFIDSNILRRYHLQMIEKQQRKQREQLTENNAEGGPIGSTQQNTVITLEGFQGTMKDKPVPAPAPTSTYSKYAINAKANLKKLRKQAASVGGEEYDTSAGRKKRKPNEAEEDPSLKTPLDEAALGSLLGSLRRNFAESDTQHPASSMEQSAAVRSQKKDVSFSALLDTSQMFDDDDEDDEFDAASKGLLRPAQAVLTKTITSVQPEQKIPRTSERDVSFSALLDTGSSNRAMDEDVAFDDEPITPQNDDIGRLPDTVPNTIPNTDAYGTVKSETNAGTYSVYQIKRPSQRKPPAAIAATPNLTQTDTEDLLSFEIESSGDCPLLSGPASADSGESADSYVPGIRTQTRKKLQRFVFQPKRPVPNDEDSAYDSMLRDKTIPARIQGATGSQYSGLVGDGEDDVELNLSDIEL